MNRQPLGARHQRVQRLRRLLRRASARASEGAFVAEGVKVVEAALDAGAAVESLYVAAEGAEQPTVQALAERALAAGARVFDLGPGIMERVADTVTPQAVCAVVSEPSTTVGDVVALEAPGGAGRVVLVCVDVRDPGNLGALVRSGAAAGVTGVVCCGSTVDPYNPKTVRATAGTIFTLPVAIEHTSAVAFAALREAGFTLVATSADLGEDYGEADLGGDIALVLGNEAAGLPGEVVEQCERTVHVPMAGNTESLNVAMTATVIAFDIARRRRVAAIGRAGLS